MQTVDELNRDCLPLLKSIKEFGHYHGHTHTQTHERTQTLTTLHYVIPK